MSCICPLYICQTTCKLTLVHRYVRRYPSEGSQGPDSTALTWQERTGTATASDAIQVQVMLHVFSQSRVCNMSCTALEA